MFDKIIKRDGRVVDFDQERIINAIFKASRAVGEADRALASRLSSEVVEKLDKKFKSMMPSVEDIQDIVEEVLIEHGEAEIARAYILYRRQHQEIRDFRSLMINIEQMISEYVNVENWRVKENSNMTYSLQGLNNHIISGVTSRYWLERIYPENIKTAHSEGKLHIHDLSLLAPYCCGWDLEDLLLEGFRGVRNKIESGPANHFRSALGQINNFLFSLQGEAAGAQAFSNFDTYLAPFIAHDGLNYKQVKQAVQEFIFNINVPTRVGFQTPFVNITLDVVVPRNLKNEPAIIGGKRQESSFGEYQQEMNMLNEAFCEVMMEGDVKGRVFSFPIPTYNITEDFEWDSPVVEKIMKMTAKFGIPYFANFVNSDMNPEDARSMCCRLRLNNRELRKRGGGLFGANPLTGSIGVVSLNMPRIGYLSSSRSEFFKQTGELMDLARDSLEIKRKLLEKMTSGGLYPYSRFYLRRVHERFGDYWKNHFNTIGLVGMNEALVNFMDKDISTAEGREFSGQVLDFMRERLVEYQKETGELFNLEATPAESTVYRLAKLDDQKYPDMYKSGKEVCYYTNSTQLPVGYTDDLFDELDHQDELQIKYTGGTVLHTYLGERLDNIDTCKRLLKKIVNNYRLPYLTLTPTFSICPDHGYLNGEEFECPECGSRTEVWTRVVGYFRPVQNWNEGKRSEYEEREEFAVNA